MSTKKARKAKTPALRRRTTDVGSHFVTDDPAPDPLDVELDTLTEKQRRFVEEYMTDGNATQAAIRAGYAESGARQEGHRLLTNADVRQAIRRRIAQDGRIATREERQLFFTQTMHDPDVDRSARLRAAELLGKTQGDFVEQVEARSDVHYHITWDDDDEPATTVAAVTRPPKKRVASGRRG